MSAAHRNGGELVVLEPLGLKHVRTLLEIAAVTAPVASHTYVPESEPALRVHVDA